MTHIIHDKTITLNLRIPFEGQPETAPEVAVYAFDGSGRLLSSVKIKDAQATISISERNLDRLRLFVAPLELRTGKEKATIEDMQRAHAYEPVWRYDPKAQIQQLLPILQNFWKYWLFCLCRVRGQVVKPSDIGGTTVDCPVPAARVHICEVDPFFWIIYKLPEPIILRLKDEWLAALEQPPIPEPGPDPAPFQLQQVLLNPQPLASKVSLLSQLPLETRIALASRSVDTVRAELAANIKLIRPFLCLWPWFWPWLRYDEIAVVDTDTQGRFDYTILYPCAGDKPDLYFWVEYQIGGVWTTVYNPPVRCNTYWDYACGTEITIRITDPRVFGAQPGNTLTGQKVNIERIGWFYTNRIGSGGILSPITIPLGLTESITVQPSWTSTNMNCAFGGTLAPHVEFSADALLAAGITHYRWSYQRLQDNEITPVDGVWYYIDAPVVHTYNEVDPDADTYDVRPFVLGPDPACSSPLFKIAPFTPPKLKSDNIVWWQQSRQNEASAYLDTNAIAKLAGETQTHGYLQLKLELFHIAAGAAALNKLERSTFVVPPNSTTFNPSSYTADQAPNAAVQLETDGSVSAFFMRIYVDNRSTEAVIQETQVNHVNPSHWSPPRSSDKAGPCGMIPYEAGDFATLSYKAYQPGNFAVFKFDVYKGSSGIVNMVSTESIVAGPAAIYGSPDATSHIFSKAFDGGTLVKDKTPDCTSAAFSENLYLYAAVLDGYDWLYGLNSSDVKAFALTSA